jgi:hypothetical protein
MAALLSPGEQLQLDCFGRVSAADYFSDVEVIHDRPRSADAAILIETRIDNVLAGLNKKNGKAGAVVRVLMPAFDVPEPEMPGPYGERIIILRSIENPMVNMGTNGSGKSAEDIADNVLAELNDFRPGPFDILYSARRAIEPVEALLKKGQIAYDVSLRQKGGLTPVIKAAMPTIAQDESGVALTSATDGASIYYTIDGSYPWPGNDQAILYDAPFAVEPPLSLRAIAYATGFHASDVASADITPL